MTAFRSIFVRAGLVALEGTPAPLGMMPFEERIDVQTEDRIVVPKLSTYNGLVSDGANSVA